MASNDRFVILRETRRNMEKIYETSEPKIQTVPSYMHEGDKYEKYYSPKLISFGPIHHGDPKLKRGEQYKLMWASMYAEAARRSPRKLHQSIIRNIKELRELFSWDEIKLLHDRYSNEELAWMLFVDGCAVLQILEKANISKPENLRVKLDTLVLVERDLFLLENQLPFQLLNLLSQDEVKLKITMHGFCELQNMFTALDSTDSPLFSDPQHHIETIKKSPPPTHLLDCLCTSILSFGMESTKNDKPVHQIERGDQNLPTTEHLINDLRASNFRGHVGSISLHGYRKLQKMSSVRKIEHDIEIGEQSSTLPPISQSSIENYEEHEKKIRAAKKLQRAYRATRMLKEGREQTLRNLLNQAREARAHRLYYKAGNLLDVADIYAKRKKKEKYTSYRNIQELKAAAIRIKTQKNIGLKDIAFSSSFFVGTLLLPPLILDSSTVLTLFNLVAYEMCPDYINKFRINSYLKLLDLLIDHQDDVKELRSSGILHNSLGSDEDVVELFNTMSSCLVHNPSLYSGIKNQVESHYKNKLSIWMAEAHYSYFKSPWTIIAFLAALIALVLTALQTWQGIKSP